MSGSSSPTETLASEVTATETPEDRASRTPEMLAPGARVGRYLVERVIGAGGMGVVVAARDPELDRCVALKLLRERGSDVDGAAQARLVREAQALARLQHPNVVVVHDVGLVAGRVFVAMELIDGVTLRTWLTQEPHHWREVVRVFAAAGRGLAAAHDAELVHRDFKPDNVLVGRDGSVRVADFGLASPDPGTVVGTPAYMAPEQHAGDDVGPAADQFAFFVALWEAVCGARPFDGDSVEALAAAKRAARFAPVARRAPRWLTTALRRGLAPEPAARHAAMSDVVDALERGLGRRRRATLGIAAVLVAAAGATAAAVAMDGDRPGGPACASGAEARGRALWNDGLAAAVTRAFAATDRPHAAASAAVVAAMLEQRRTDWVAAHIATCEATEVRHEQSPALLDVRMHCLDRRHDETRALTDLLVAADGALVDLAAQAVARLEPVARCSAVESLVLLPAPPTEPIAAARLHEAEATLARANAADKAGRYPEGLALVSPVVAVAGELDYAPVEAEAYLQQASLQRRQGRAADAEVSAMQALDAAARARDDLTAARAAIEATAAVREQARLDEARTLERVASAAVVRSGDDRSARLALLRERGALRRAAGDLEGAHAAFVEALDVARTLGGDSVEVASILNNTGLVLTEMGQRGAAKARLEEALAVYERTVGTSHPRALSAAANLARVLAENGDLAAARTRFEAVLAAEERALGAEHPSVAATVMSLGTLAVNQGRLDDAVALFRRAIATLEHARGPEHPDVAAVLGDLAEVLRFRGDLDEAGALLERALRINEAALGAEHPDVATDHVRLGHLALKRGQHGDARRHYERALVIRERALGADHEDAASVHGALGDVAQAEGRCGEARRHFARELAIREAKVGASHASLIEPLVGLGACIYKGGDARGALGPLDRAVSIAEATEASPYAAASARDALARALWDARGDRRRAVALERSARADLTAAGRDTAEIDRWLSTHSAP